MEYKPKQYFDKNIEASLHVVAPEKKIMPKKVY